MRALKILFKNKVRDDILITVRNRSYGKVMFLQASVILFTGQKGCVSQHALGKTPPGQTPPIRHPLVRHPPGQTPPDRQPPPATDGTHPTGMHSCFILYYIIVVIGDSCSYLIGLQRVFA